MKMKLQLDKRIQQVHFHFELASVLVTLRTCSSVTLVISSHLWEIVRVTWKEASTSVTGPAPSSSCASQSVNRHISPSFPMLTYSHYLFGSFSFYLIKTDIKFHNKNHDFFMGIFGLSNEKKWGSCWLLCWAKKHENNI